MNSSPKPHVGLRKTRHKYCVESLNTIHLITVHVTESKVVLGLDLEKKSLSENQYPRHELGSSDQDQTLDQWLKTKNKTLTVLNVSAVATQDLVYKTIHNITRRAIGLYRMIDR